MKSHNEIWCKLQQVLVEYDRIRAIHKGTGVDPRPSLVPVTAQIEILEWILHPTQETNV